MVGASWFELEGARGSCPAVRPTELGGCACENPCTTTSLVCPLELVVDDSRVFDECDAAGSFQSPWDVGELGE